LRLFLSALADVHSARSLSPELRQYVFQAAQHAAHFVSNPEMRVPRGWPEAVDLAFGIRYDDNLVNEILELKTENDFAPELAQKLLHEFQPNVAGDRAAVAG
jgi:hypothetical protein